MWSCSLLADASSSQWLIDSGASKHMCFDQGSFDQNTFVSGTPLGVSGVVMGNGSLAAVLGTGQVTITTRVGKKLQSIVLRDVLYVPALRRNLLSVSSLRDHHKMLFNRDQVLITQYGGRCVAVASHKDNLYMLKQLHVATAEVNLVDQRSSNLLMVWHRRLGHIGFRSLQRLASLGRLGSLTKAVAQDFKLCVGCLGGNFFHKSIPH